jgi:hypothetical protein
VIHKYRYIQHAMLRHGSNSFLSKPQSGAAVRTPASSSFTIHPRRLTSPIGIDLAVGWWGVIDGRQRMGRPSLHERAPVGQKIPVLRRSGSFGPTKIRATADLRQGGRHRGDQGSRCPAKRSGTAFYDLVAAQIARIPEPATGPKGDHAIDDRSPAPSGGISLL